MGSAGCYRTGARGRSFRASPRACGKCRRREPPALAPIEEFNVGFLFRVPGRICRRAIPWGVHQSCRPSAIRVVAPEEMRGAVLGHQGRHDPPMPERVSHIDRETFATPFIKHIEGPKVALPDAPAPKACHHRLQRRDHRSVGPQPVRRRRVVDRPREPRNRAGPPNRPPMFPRQDLRDRPPRGWRYVCGRLRP